MVNVDYNNRTIQLRLYVVNGSDHNSLGHDWINALDLNSRTLDDIVSNTSMLSVISGVHTLNELFICYKNIFNDGLGCCKVKAHLHIKPNAIPKFCKPRSLPFAYCEAIEHDLNRFITEGVIEPISVSKWAVPIVVVPKSGGKVRICVDLSTTVNQALDTNQYRLLKSVSQ